MYTLVDVGGKILHSFFKMKQKTLFFSFFLFFFSIFSVFYTHTISFSGLFLLAPPPHPIESNSPLILYTCPWIFCETPSAVSRWWSFSACFCRPGPWRNFWTRRRRPSAVSPWNRRLSCPGEDCRAGHFPSGYARRLPFSPHPFSPERNADNRLKTFCGENQPYL